MVAIFSGPSPILGARYPFLFLVVSCAYLAEALLIAVARRGTNSTSQQIIALQMGVDIVAIVTAVHASGGVGSGLAGLLVVFVAASGLSLSGKRAYLAAAVATLVILGEQGLSFLQGVAPAAGFLQAGVL
ncbi:MAG: hypothetical protein ACR2P6_05420, partial [Gammaproteobacteria bacterium]